MFFFLLCLAVNLVHGKKASYQTHHPHALKSLKLAYICPLLPELLFSSSFERCVVLVLFVCLFLKTGYH